MNILFEINHPGHIHLFKNLAIELETKGISSHFLIKSEPVTERLAKIYNLKYIKIGSKKKGLILKYFFQIFVLLKTIRFVNKVKPKIGLGVSMNLPQVSRFTKMESIGFDDDDMAVTPVFAKYANKASVILTPSSLSHEKRGEHHIAYNGFHELAYLHPKRFDPEKEIFEMLGIDKNSDYFVVRFNSFQAHHDIGHRGMTFMQKKELVLKLKEYGKVFISSEGKVDPGFDDDLLPDRPEYMHSILAFARMYVGESQTMTSEAAILGTPALKCNTFAGKLSIPNELEKIYSLCFSFCPEEFDHMLSKIEELLALPELKKEWQQRRNRMLLDKIDVTGFLVWFVENYPASFSIMKKDPSFQFHFS